MVNTRATDYDKMADIKELMELLKAQREEDERIRIEEREAHERRRKEEREEEEKRRIEDERRHREEFMELLKTQKEEEEKKRIEDERKRREEREADERRRIEERAEEDKRRIEDERKRREEREADEKRRREEKVEEERHREELLKILELIQRRSKEDIDAVREDVGEVRQSVGEVRQSVGEVQQEVRQSVGEVQQEVRQSVEEVRQEIGMVRDECKELEQRVLKKIRNELSDQRGMMPLAKGQLQVQAAGPESKAVIEIPTSSANYKCLKPPTFDGETSWTMYKRQFEAAAVTNGWSDHQKATALVLALRGKALEILQNIPESKQGDYAAVVSALELRYGNKYLGQVYQCQLKSRIQGSSESLQEFGADIERIVRLAYPQAPEDFVNQISIQSFVDGIKDTELQQALRLGRFKNLSEAVIYGLEFEAAKNASGYRRGKVREVKFDDGGKCSSEDVCQKIEEKLEALLQKYLNTDQRVRREGQVQCYNCGGRGHIRRNCRRSRSEERYKREPTVSSNQNRVQGNAISPV